MTTQLISESNTYTSEAGYFRITRSYKEHLDSMSGIPDRRELTSIEITGTLPEEELDHIKKYLMKQHSVFSFI